MIFLIKTRSMKINVAHVIYQLSRELNAVNWVERSVLLVDLSDNMLGKISLFE